MYKRIDYFKKKDLVLADTTYNEALGTSVSTEIIYDDKRKYRRSQQSND